MADRSFFGYTPIQSRLFWQKIGQVDFGPANAHSLGKSQSGDILDGLSVVQASQDDPLAGDTALRSSRISGEKE